MRVVSRCSDEQAATPRGCPGRRALYPSPACCSAPAPPAAHWTGRRECDAHAVEPENITLLEKEI